jgi:hypothetical protein
MLIFPVASIAGKLPVTGAEPVKVAVAVEEYLPIEVPDSEVANLPMEVP